MHSYVMTDGAQRWANATNPQIPAALASVVGGVASLNNFPPHKMSRSFGAVRKDNKTGKTARLFRSSLTLAVAMDRARIVLRLGQRILQRSTTFRPQSPPGAGTGQIIAIVSDSDITLSDLTVPQYIRTAPSHV